MSMPSQKPGMAMKRIDMARASPSGTLLGLNALRMPTGRPTTHDTSSARIPISALIGPRWAMSSATVSPRKNDLPSRPAPMSPSQRTYCTGSGALRPRSAMMRTRSAGVMRAWPSTPRIATRGSPGRTRRMTKMLIDTPSSVMPAYTARRARYFFNNARGGPRDGPPRPPTLVAPWATRGAPRLRELPEPDVVPPNDVIDPEVCAPVLAVHAVVPRVVDLLVRDRDERRIVLEDVFSLAHQHSALVVVQLAVDLAGDVVERGVGPPGVVLRAVLAVPRAEDVGGIHQRGDDGADRQIEVAGHRLIEPHRCLDDAKIGL